MAKQSKSISADMIDELLSILKKRFELNSNMHPKIQWSKIEEKLKNNSEKLASLWAMEQTGGEPDVIDYDSKSDTYIFCDCSPESPKGRRSLCYDLDAWNERKEHKPERSALDLAEEMGITILNETEYRALQTLGSFDQKTSSWLQTPEKIRKLGGAIFGDYRYATVFIYHNGAISYYAARGFRGKLTV